MARSRKEATSALRRDMRACIEEYCAAARTLPGAVDMVRGTVYWSRRAGGKRYPNISVTEQGERAKHRVRVKDMEWLGELLARHRAYRGTQSRLRALHRRTMALSERLRAVMTRDYEPRAEASAYLVKVKGVRHGA